MFALAAITAFLVEVVAALEKVLKGV